MIILYSAAALLCGFIIDCFIGDPHSIPHPVVFIGKLISVLEKLLRKSFPKTARGERAAGTFLVIAVTFVSAVVPLAVLILCLMVHPALYIAAESVMCWQILAAKSLRDESMKVYKSIKKGDVEEARFNVSMIVGRDTAVLDESGIIRAAVETVAENTSDGVIAPMIYCAIGGAPLGFFYKAVNTMDSMVGYKNDKYINFGRSAAIFDDIANYIPSRLSALIMIFSCIFGGFNTKRAYKIWRRDRRKHASPNSAQTESVCAGALEVRLAGDAYYHGKLCEKEYIGDAVREIENEDIRGVNRLMYTAAVVSLVVSLALKAAAGFIIICL